MEFNYLSDFEKDTDVKIGICAVVGKISPKIGSHKGAWPHMLANQACNAGYTNVEVITLNDTNWEDYDVILIDHGMEFKGTFNVFGGANDDLYNQVIRLFKNVRMYSMHVDMPCVGTMVQQRLHTGTDLFKTIEPRIEEMKEICSKIQRIDHIEKTNKLCFGDSHSFSMYQAGYMTQRHDGLTMHGALKRGLQTYVYPWITDLTVYLGNIDVRHHLMRQDNPSASVKTLLKKYEEEVLSLGIKNIEIVHTLPIENESRLLPKTGYYKGTPFAGTWFERTALVKEINAGIDEMCDRNGWKAYKHPEVYYTGSGELSFDVMEVPKSVHLSREYYRWDMAKNTANPKLKKQIAALF
jgi:hypothetical protein